jgi:integrase
MRRIVVPKDPPRSDALNEVDPKAAYATVQTLPPRERALLATCLLAGMRPSEVQALRRCDVDQENGRINVTRGYSGTTLTTPKTAAGIRRVGLLDSLSAEIRIWREWVTEHRDARWLEEEALIFAREGDPHTPVTRLTIAQMAKRHVSLEEWEAIKPRSGRHLWVSANIAGGVDLVESMRSTGHTSPKVHLDTYGRQVAGKSAAVRDARSSHSSCETRAGTSQSLRRSLLW